MQRDWSVVEGTTAVQLYTEENKSDSEIAKTLRAKGFSRSRSEVKNYLWRTIPNERHRRNQGRQVQYAARRDEALRLARSGMTATKVAKKTGRPLWEVYYRVSRQDRADGYAAFQFRTYLDQISPSQKIEPDPVTTDGFELADLDPSGCRWPIGVSENKTTFRFCGCLRLPGVGKDFSAYCGGHAAKAKA